MIQKGDLEFGDIVWTEFDPTDSVAKVYCVTSFDYSRFSKKIGKISSDTRNSIKAYLRKHFDL